MGCILPGGPLSSSVETTTEVDAIQKCSPVLCNTYLWVQILRTQNILSKIKKGCKLLRRIWRIWYHICIWKLSFTGHHILRINDFLFVEVIKSPTFLIKRISEKRLLAQNLSLSKSWSWIYARQLKLRICEYDDVFPCNDSYGIFPFSKNDGVLLMRYPAV